MRFVSLFAAALALSSPALSQPSAMWDAADLNKTIDQTNFVVNAGCSGTLIDAEKGLIITAKHCVDNQYETITREHIAEDGTVTLKKVRRLIDGTVTQLVFAGTERVKRVTYRTRLVATSFDYDLSLVKVVAPLPADYKAAKMGCVEPVRGEQVYVVGNPAGILYSSVTSGIVSSVQRNYEMLGVIDDEFGSDKSGLMQISNGVVGGNSGGSVWNAKGELVGVPVRAHRFNEVLGFAEPLSSIRTFLRANSAGGLFDHCGEQK